MNWGAVCASWLFQAGSFLVRGLAENLLLYLEINNQIHLAVCRCTNEYCQLLQNISKWKFSMYWNTVQVVNCTIQNTQAMCLWNVKKALNVFCYCPNIVAFWGVKRWSWRSGTAAIRVSRLEKVSKNLLLKKFQSIGSCPLARVFWYLRNVPIGKYLCLRNFQTQKVL